MFGAEAGVADVWVAVIGLVVVLVTLWGQRHQNKKTRAEVRQVDDKVQKQSDAIATNHGKQPFEYLEMIADVHREVEQVKLGQTLTYGAVESLLNLLDEHTQSDTQNFEELRSLLRVAAIGAAADRAREADA